MDVCLFSSALPGWAASRVARAVLAAGLTAVEWGVGPGQAVESPRGAAAALNRLGVEAAGVCVQGGAASLTAPARLAPFAALAAELGAPYVRVFAPALRDRGRARAGLEAATEVAAEHGVAVLIETAPGTIAPSTAQARALVDGLPSERAGVLYDPGNMAIEGHVDPRLAVAELGPTSATCTSRTSSGAVRTAPGAGGTRRLTRACSTGRRSSARSGGEATAAGSRSTISAAGRRPRRCGAS